MDLHQEFESAHAEHAEILKFLKLWEGALKLVAGDDLDARCLGLEQLQAMEGEIAEICEHCRKEEEDPESPLFRFADAEDRSRLKDEHFRLYQANYQFRREMALTTSTFSSELVPQGEKLLDALRDHIDFEERLLRGFEFDHLRLPEALAHA
jgi:hypothetical protein